MKILVIGDPHGDLEKIKQIPIKGVDLILLTGDIGKADFARKRFFENVERKKQGLKELKYDGKASKIAYKEISDSTLNVLKYLSKFSPIYSILGNVGNNMVKDYEVKKDEEKYKIKLPYLGREIKKIKEFHLTINRLRKINELRIGFLEYFSDVSWVKEFKPKDYKKSMKRAKKETEKAKKILKRFGKIDILICHQPPYGVLDKVGAPAPMHWRGKHAGSKAVLDYIKKYQPRYVFCGHIHEGEGKVKIGKTQVYNLGVAGHKIIGL
ncbi:MAG: metallophosphoesterase [Nanoarchaeota archaeon]|nr:metallophosphoesterase [Nanoarchaeota archaeon]